jgi:hypothetical protein
MPNTLYDKAREAFLNGQIKWSGVGSDEIRIALITSGYTLDVANHTTLSQIKDAQNKTAILQKSVPLENKTSDKGVADASDVTFSVANGNTAVPAGEVRAIIIYQAGPTESTSKLIAYLDQINGLPIKTTASATDLTIHWDNGTNKIFKL